MLKRLRPGKKLCPGNKLGNESNLSIFNLNAHLAHASDEVFLHLAGHSRLLCPVECRSVRIRIRGNSTEDRWRLVYAQPVINAVVMTSQLLKDGFIRAARDRSLQHLAHSKQQL